jgi:hypothetical protein
VSVTDDLPGYPSRIVPATGGGAWLTCFILRTQLVEFVLREPTYRKRMIAEIDPAYWIAPALNSGNTFLEPMQGAQRDRAGKKKPGVGAAGLQQGGEIAHNPTIDALNQG